MLRDATTETRQPKQKGICGARHYAPSPNGQELVEHGCDTKETLEHSTHGCGDHEWTTAETSRWAS